MRARRPFFQLGAGALVLTALSACGTEFNYDSTSFFPEDYRSAYTQHDKHDCTVSPTHGGARVKIWLSPEVAPAYGEGDGEAPEGAVAIKEQFADEECEELSSITAFKKDAASAGGWQWQRVQEDGSVEFSGEQASCSGCHASCEDGAYCSR